MSSFNMCYICNFIFSRDFDIASHYALHKAAPKSNVGDKPNE